MTSICEPFTLYIKAHEADSVEFAVHVNAISHVSLAYNSDEKD